MPDDGRIENLSAESINRLHAVNKIRDILRENDDYLQKQGIQRILSFGSVVKGGASSKSDIDLLVLHEPTLGSYIEYGKWRTGVEKKLQELFLPLGLVVSAHTSKDKKGDVIHLTFDLEQELYRYSLPDYARDSMELWSAENQIKK